MNFDALRRRVERAEQLVDGRIAQTGAHREALGRRWREAWTPGRILLAGLVGGLLVGRARPMRAFAAVSATRWIQLATSVSGLLASLKAAQSAASAETAASDAETAAADAAGTVEAAVGEGVAAEVAPEAEAEAEDAAPRTVSDARRRPDARFESEPRPAEAATELSER